MRKRSIEKEAVSKNARASDRLEKVRTRGRFVALRPVLMMQEISHGDISNVTTSAAYEAITRTRIYGCGCGACRSLPCHSLKRLCRVIACFAFVDLREVLLGQA